MRLRRRVVAAKQFQGQPAGVLLREQLDLQLAPAGLLPQRPQAGAGVAVLTAVAAQQQQRRRVGRGQQVGQQGGTVRITPLQVVNVQDERLHGGEAAEQVAQGGEGPAAQLVRVGHAGRLTVRGVGDCRDAPQHREQSHQRRRVERQQVGGLVPAQPRQMAAQRVDEAVQRLVRHRLLLVAAPRQHQRRAGVRQPVEEVLHEKGLAGAGPAVYVDGRRLAAPGRL